MKDYRYIAKAAKAHGPLLILIINELRLHLTEMNTKHITFSIFHLQKLIHLVIHPL